MAKKIRDIFEFYNFMDELSLQLKQAGFLKEAEEIYALIHKHAWTTSSELLGELRISLRKFRKQNGIPAQIRRGIKSGIDTINYFLYGIYMPDTIIYVMEILQNSLFKGL